jgi:DNA-binding NarL/FixJ family response regulator
MRLQPVRVDVRVMIVDSHPLVRWALTQLCAQDGAVTVVAEAASATEALSDAFALIPDVVTVECSAGDETGWALAARLRAAYPAMGIVVLSAGASDDLLLRALNSGASAYVAKSAPISDVLAAIRHAAASPSSFSAAGLAQALQRRASAQTSVSLSPREQEILVLLHEGLSVPAIAAQLYVSLSTAKTYVARLYDKLEARNRAQALMTAVRLGLLEQQLAAAAG